MLARMSAFSAGLSVVVAAQPIPPAPIPPPLLELPAVRSLIPRLAEVAPELREAQARIEAERAKVGPAGSLPDPEVSLGLNRSMDASVMIESTVQHVDASALSGMLPARTETSLMASQVLPWPGKRAARTSLAEVGVRQAESEWNTRRLASEGELLDLILDLVALRAQRVLLQDQDRHWAAAEELAKTCCELGRGSTSDLLLAIQSRARLRQRSMLLELREADYTEALVRLTGLPEASAALQGIDLLKLPQPAPIAAEVLTSDLLARNPQWHQLAVAQEGAGKALTLAQVERRPDIRLSGGLMTEGGMAPGWKAEVGLSIPLFSRRKQDQVVAQRRAEQDQVSHAREALRRIIIQRARERARAWQLARTTLDLVTRELLPAGEATLQALLAQYENGRTEFTAILATLNALLADRESQLASMVALHRISLHQYRAGLEPPPSLELGSPTMTAGSTTTPRTPMPENAPKPSTPDAAPAAAPMKM